VEKGTVEDRFVTNDLTGEREKNGIDIRYEGFPVTIKKVPNPKDPDGKPLAVSLFSLPLNGIRLKNGVENPTIADVLIYVNELFKRLDKSRGKLAQLAENSDEFNATKKEIDTAVAELNQVIKDLTKFKYFETLFNTWENYRNTNTDNWTVKTRYD
jgi:hypothetical protein